MSRPVHRLVVTTTLAVAGVLASASGAGATTVTGGATIEIVGNPGDRDGFEVLWARRSDVVLVQPDVNAFDPAPIVAGPGCIQDGDSAECPAVGLRDLEITAGDQRDEVSIEIERPNRLASSVDLGGGDDTFRGGLVNGSTSLSTESVSVSGGAGRDLIVGGAVRDRIRGGPGPDLLTGSSGNDVLDGGPGEDDVYGDEDNDAVRGASGRDYVYGGPDDDLVIGGNDNDDVVGARGDDVLKGKGGDDDIDSAHRIVGENRAKLREGGTDRSNCGPGRDELIRDPFDRGVKCERVELD